MNILITICARGGSKGIPGKNIKPINGKPLIGYTIDVANKFKATFKDVDIALSTDSDKISEVARSCGLSSDYKRPDYLANDTVGKIDAIKDILLYSEKKNHCSYEYVLDLDVTSPLRTLQDLEAAFAILQKDENAVNAAREKETIDYTAVYNAKIKALQNIFERVQQNATSEYAKEFQAFKKADSGELNRLAVFQALCHARCIADEKNAKKIQELLSSALGSDVEKFAHKHAAEIDFFKFLQFEADRQLRLVEKKIKDRNLAIGLYRDLPVGVSKDSAEVWSDRYLYMQESGAGAPPDSCFPTGQKWGLGAFNPFELKERCYKPFIRILRANMRYAGALRIDHVMGLSRLYLIPDKGEEGTYLAYNVKDMFNILALESYLNKCIVVGESIGNVADGFKDMLTERNIYSLGVLWNERRQDGFSFKSPNEYETLYFASVGTHDMPPLKAWWFGTEVGLMKDLQLFTPEEATNAYKCREHERWLLLNAMDNEGVWPEDKRRQGDYLFGEGYPEGIEEAVHGYMAKSNSVVFMLQPEDVFQSMRIQNLPGTDIDKYPNWRTKLPVDVEDMRNSEAYHRNINVVKKWRSL